MSEQLLLPAFENEILEINIEELHFSKDVPPQLLMGRKFQVILASIKEVGIIEPPVVTVKMENISCWMDIWEFQRSNNLVFQRSVV